MSRPDSPKSKVPKKTSLETLPPETLQLILLHLPDLPSLLCAAISSRVIYRSFRSNESLLVPTILQHQIPASVLTSALAAQAAARIKVICVETTREFFHTYLQPPPSSPPPLIPARLKDGIPISRLHFFVRSFSRGFANRTLAKQPQYKGKDEMGVSGKEMERIERAFYRFEIYNNLFRRKQGNPRHAAEDQVDTFFSAFSGWENEQLAVIHEFLAGLIMPVFNELAEHDVLWGSHGIGPTTESSSEFIQAILGRGLLGLHRLTRTKTYSQKMKALYTPYPTYYTKFLYRGLEAYYVNLAFTRDKTDREFYKESDPGPREVWTWARQGITPLPNIDTTQFWNQLSEARSWAYVFWDHSRLDAWGVLKTPFTSPVESEATRCEAIQKQLRLEASIARRSAIQVAGGSGYWSAEDESKIIFRANKASPHDSAAKRKECTVCFGEVSCAPHRLVLKLPPKKEIAKGVTDDGCFLELENDGVGAMPRRVMSTAESDHFRLSRMPTLLQTSSASLFGASESRRSSYMVGPGGSGSLRTRARWE